jgi:hypothetical protein
MCRPFSELSCRPTLVALIFGVLFSLSSTFAEAGPCSADIAQFELAIRQSSGNPYAGLTAPQSVAAQNDRQPTVASMKKAERNLKAKFAATVAQAKRLDARNDRVGCERALSIAKEMYIL